MPHKRTKIKLPSLEYLEKAKALPKAEAERLMSRMKGRFARRFEDKKFSKTEVLALQLEFEDEQLREWRKNMALIRARNKGSAKEK